MDRLNSAKKKWTAIISLSMPLAVMVYMYWTETLTISRPLPSMSPQRSSQDHTLDSRLIQQQRGQSGNRGPPPLKNMIGPPGLGTSSSQSNGTTEKNMSISDGGLENTFVFSKQSLNNAALHNAAKEGEDVNKKFTIVINNGQMLAESIDAENGTGERGSDGFIEPPPPSKDLGGYVSVINSKNHMHLKCPKCAYVSSSGQLQGKRAGELIDSFPCVIRMNDAPTTGYEADVGSKTTVRVIAHSSMAGVRAKKSALLTGPGQPKFILVWGPPNRMTTNGKGAAYNMAAGLAHDKALSSIQVFMLSQRQYDYADKVFEIETGRNRMSSGSWLSTGWFAMLFARAACDEIHVFGMVSDTYCRDHPDSSVPYHYYELTRAAECRTYKIHEGAKHSGHRFVTEKAVFARWSKLDPNITFHHPDWSGKD